MNERYAMKDDGIVRSVKWIISLFVSFSVVTSHAQTAAHWMGWGDDAMARGDHYGASRFYGHAMELEPGLLELQWKTAEACRLSQQYPQAAANYEKVVKKDAGRKHPEALRWLAEMQMCAADYDAALRTWNKVKQKEHDNTSFTEKRAENGIKGCALAKELMAAPEEVEVEHLPGTVNTYDSEFGGRIGFDSAFWFTSLRGAVNSEGEVLDTAAYHVAIYRSANNAGGLVTAERIKSPFTGEADNANVCWGENGRAYFTQCNGGALCAIFTSSGSTPQPLDGIGVGVNSTQPMVVRIDGSWKLFFASDRPGGGGGMDIWMGNLNGAEVTDIHPLGAPVNTPGNECCPFYDEVQHKLYFSSDFHPGMGGYDNFMSEHRDDVFGEPQNFKYPLNSPANDLYPTFDMRTMSGYFTSNRIGSLAAKGETCCNDIYAYRYDKPVEVAALPVDTNLTLAVKRITTLREKLPVRLYFHNDEPEPRSWDTLTAQTYEQTYRAYKDRVPDYHEAWKENHASIDAFFSNSVDGGFQQLGEFLVLLREALDQGQQVKLIVRGFASPLAKSDYNVHTWTGTRPVVGVC